MDGRQQPLTIRLTELGQLARRGQHRRVESVVGVPAAHPADRALIAKDRVDAAVVARRTQQCVGFRRQYLGAELGQRTRIAGRQDPPAHLPLLAELLHQDRWPLLESEPDPPPGASWSWAAPPRRRGRPVTDGTTAGGRRRNRSRRTCRGYARTRRSPRPARPVGASPSSTRRTTAHRQPRRRRPPPPRRAARRAHGSREARASLRPARRRRRARSSRIRRSGQRACGATRCRPATSTPPGSASRIGTRVSSH